MNNGPIDGIVGAMSGGQMATIVFGNAMEALDAAAARFEQYALNHRRKDPPQHEKAAANSEIAFAIRELIGREGKRFDATAKAMEMTAKTLAAYALNAAHGAELAPFEMTNLIGLAKTVGCVVEDRHAQYALTRSILGRVFSERRKQVEVFGYKPEDDVANPERLREEVLNRVSGMPDEHAEQALVEAGAIIVAELEAIARRRQIAAQDAALAAQERNLEAAGVPT